ncbi:MAG: helix-turn-helix transcriptional regulator [Clostridia bacterium]|nr:helix-turn-helix transcriptional regulator [Clostridia bacterium]
MGRKSTRENKTAYQLAREKRGLTIEKAGEALGGLTSDRISKIENGSVHVQPEDVVLMAECYKAPELCNYYCTHECAIGEKTVEAVEIKSFAQIAIETLNSLNKMTRLSNRLLEIVEDGQVRPDESDDFLVIKSTLDKIAASVSALQLWVDRQIAEGKLDRELFSKS